MNRIPRPSMGRGSMPERSLSKVQEKRLKKIGVVSSANISGLIGVVLGFITGIFFAIVGMAFSSAGGLSDSFSFLGMSGFILIIVLPFFYGVVSWISGAASAVIYNLSAKVTKGVKITFE